MSSTEVAMRPATIVFAALGTLVTGVLAYAVYFDHKRQTDPEFRRSLKRQAREAARAARQDAEAAGAKQRQAIRAAVEQVRAEGLPQGVEEKEAFFMSEISQAEMLVQDESQWITAATCFYRALKVYPAPRDLIGIYDKTVPKPVIDLIAEMIAMDPNINLNMSATSSRGGSGPSSDRGIDD